MKSYNIRNATTMDFLFIFLSILVLAVWTFATVEKPPIEKVLDGRIRTLAGLPSGELLVAGDFPNGFLYKLTADKKINWDFKSKNESGGFNNSIASIVVDSEDSILVGGKFTNYDQSVVGRIIKITSDGSIDMDFANRSGVGFDGDVTSMVLIPDGGVVVAGVFENYNGSEAKFFARLDSKGVLDSSFSKGFNGPVNVVKLSRDGDSILVGGRFTKYGELSALNFARIDLRGNLLK